MRLTLAKRPRYANGHATRTHGAAVAKSGNDHAIKNYRSSHSYRYENCYNLVYLVFLVTMYTKIDELTLLFYRSH
ncbi:hypothetical protein [Moorena bouillonii]|uniref:hypothetical protein n=1 Tax=Moorena bouillonii TaxID=207920 RepID=UPI00117F9EA7|nr:hypothetical protein [Moorena bouillonii]